MMRGLRQILPAGRLLCAVALVAACRDAAGGGHFMAGQRDPVRVPSWELAFEGGPFTKPREPQGALVHFPATTAVAGVQRWFDAGLTALHQRDEAQARRCFREVITLDPECAMGWWGLARAFEPEPGRAGLFLGRAREKGKAAPPEERRWLDAPLPGPAEVPSRKGLISGRPDRSLPGEWKAAAVGTSEASLADVPATAARALRAGGEWLAKNARPAAAASWFEAAARAASADLFAAPYDRLAMMDFHEACGRQAACLLQAGRNDEALAAAAAAEGPLHPRMLVQLARWADLVDSPAIPEAAPAIEQAAWAHAGGVAAFELGRTEQTALRVARLREVQLLARRPEAATPAELQEIDDALAELEARSMIVSGPFSEAIRKLRQIKQPPPRLAPLFEKAGDAPAAAALAARREVPVTTEPASPPPPKFDGPLWSPRTVPDFSLPDGAAVPHTAAEFRGKPAVFLFFLGNGCEHCMRQLNLFAPWAAKYEGLGAQIVAVSLDTPTGVARTKRTGEKGERPPFPFPILADPSLESFKAWGAWDAFTSTALHGTFLVDASGRLRWAEVGPEPFMGPDSLAIMIAAFKK